MKVRRNHEDHPDHIIQSEKTGSEKRSDLPNATQQGGNRAGTRRLIA